MQLNIQALNKDNIFEEVEKFLSDKGLGIVRRDTERPWGGFFAINEEQIETFIQHFFPELSLDILGRNQKLSPKILMVGPGQRLSWQYHHRRSEVWRVEAGEVGVVVSHTDTPGPLSRMKKGETIRLERGQRHRLIGLEHWGIVAEIWKHDDPNNPSDEGDIIRLQDDFGR